MHEGDGFWVAESNDKDDERPPTFRRALRDPAFWLLLVTVVAGVAGMAWWIALPLAVAGLSISSLPKYISLWPRARDVGAEGEWWKTVWLSTLNSAGASTAAFVLGRVVHWLGWA